MSFHEKKNMHIVMDDKSMFCWSKQENYFQGNSFIITWLIEKWDLNFKSHFFKCIITETIILNPFSNGKRLLPGNELLHAYKHKQVEGTSQNYRIQEDVYSSFKPKCWSTFCNFSGTRKVGHLPEARLKSVERREEGRLKSD